MFGFSENTTTILTQGDTKIPDIYEVPAGSKGRPFDGPIAMTVNEGLLIYHMWEIDEAGYPNGVHKEIKLAQADKTPEIVFKPPYTNFNKPLQRFNGELISGLGVNKIVSPSKTESLIDYSSRDFDFGSPDFKTTALNSRGHIYIATYNKHQIYKVIPDESKIVLVAGSGEQGLKDGNGKEAQFNHPNSMAFDAQDNLYVADTGNHAIRKITPDGVVTTVYKEEGIKPWTDFTPPTANN